MKVNVEIDCTPDEARRFLGLPDVSMVQSAVLARIEQRMLEAADGFAPEAMLRNWLSLFPQSGERMGELLRNLFTPRPPASGNKQKDET